MDRSNRRLALPLLLLCGLLTSPAAADEELRALLDRSRYEGRPRVLRFSEPTLVHGDPNAAVWLQEAVAKAMTAVVDVPISAPLGDAAVKPLAARYKVVSRPLVVLCDWRGEELARFPDRIDGDKLAQALTAACRGLRPLPERESAYRQALLAKARAAEAKGQRSRAIGHVRKLLARRKPRYAAHLEGLALVEAWRQSLTGELSAALDADDAGWKQALSAAKKRYRGLPELSATLRGLERERRCRGLKREASEAIAAGDHEAARKALRLLLRERDHPASAWAKAELAKLPE